MTQADKLFIDCVCSQQGKTWISTLEKRASLWTFGQRYSQQEFKDLERKAREARKEQLFDYLAHFDPKNSGALPPPEQFGVKVEMRPAELTSANISSFGFQCLYCGQVQLLLCPVCGGISCLGDIDAANRTICIRCSTELQFGGSGENQSAPVRVKPVEASILTVENAFPRNEQPKLLRGKQQG